MISLSSILILAFATYGASRILTHDVIFRKSLERFHSWLQQPYESKPTVTAPNDKGEYQIIQPEPEVVTRRKKIGRWLSTLISCIFCVSFWIALAFIAIADIFDLLPVHASSYLIIPITVRGIAIIIARIEYLDTYFQKQFKIQDIMGGASHSHEE